MIQHLRGQFALFFLGERDALEMRRTNGRGVAVDEPNFGPDVAVRVAPVPQDDAARARSPRAHVHVASQVDAHLLFAGAVLLRRRCATFGERCGVCAELSTDSAALRSGFGFGSAVARQAASVPQRCRSLRSLSFRLRAAYLVGSNGELSAPILPLLLGVPGVAK